jgi:hypothetical protein
VRETEDSSTESDAFIPTHVGINVGINQDAGEGLSLAQKMRELWTDFHKK